MKKYLYLLLLLVCNICNAQTWQILPNSPQSSSFRHDDIFFLNKDTGWVCNVDGNIYRTNNGGKNWKFQFQQPKTSFRCIGFINDKIGWAGNLGTGRFSPTIDTMPLYKTIDGGNSWQVDTNIEGTLPKGICGLDIVNDSVIYGISRVGGPAYIIKTIDAGKHWKSIDMNSLAFQLIDAKFFSPDTGIVVGGYPGPKFQNSHYRIFYTTDGGISWKINAEGIDSGQHGWKIHFVNRKIGYVCIESDLENDTLPVLKTTDGGLTWQTKVHSISPTSFGQGIGFINDSVGWCGGFGYDIKSTINGGETWEIAPEILESFNRFRYINDTTAYAVGSRVWKYTKENLTNGINLTNSNEKFTIDKIFPNPFKDKFTLIYHLPRAGKCVIKIYDFAGRPVKEILNKRQDIGKHDIDIVIPFQINTHFFVVIDFENNKISKKVICVN